MVWGKVGPQKVHAGSMAVACIRQHVGPLRRGFSCPAIPVECARHLYWYDIRYPVIGKISLAVPIAAGGDCNVT